MHRDPDLSDLGRLVRNTVDQMLSSKDIQNIKRDIQDAMEKGFRGVPGSKAAPGPRSYGQDSRPGTGRAQQRPPRQSGWSAGRTQAPPRPEVRPAHKPQVDGRRKPPYGGYTQVGPLERQEKPKASVAGILFTVFGSIGLGIFGFLSMLGLMGAIISMESSVVNLTIAFALPALVSALFLGKGLSLCKRMKRFRIYQREIGQSQLCPIDALASAAGQSPKFVAKDLERMIRAGLFPNGHLDRGRTCLILGYETYKQYLQAEEKMKLCQQEQKRLQNAGKQPAAEKPADTGNAGLDAALSEGRKYIQQIKRANDLIPGEVVSAKIDQLERVTARIFEYVSQHPEKLPDIRRFMEYYLPTTLKLLDAYCQFDAQPVQGENITLAKREIEETLDTINQAFVNLLDGLFREDALDISTDISALEAMLAQEGLTDSDFKK